MSLQRIFMTVRRGPMDATAVCVFPWEKPILEEIHGSDASVVDIESMCDIQGGKVETLKFKHCPDAKSLSLADQYRAMTKVDDAANPAYNVDSEWDRLHVCYGAHRELAPLSNAEKVYGNLINFRKVVRDFAAGRVPEMFDDGSGDFDGITGSDDVPVADMSIEQLRAAAKKLGIAAGRRPRVEIEAEILQRQEELEAA